MSELYINVWCGQIALVFSIHSGFSFLDSIVFLANFQTDVLSYSLLLFFYGRQTQHDGPESLKSCHGNQLMCCD